MTVREFRRCVEDGGFIDYDGFGHPVRRKRVCEDVDVKPSKPETIPADATHILWFNR
jgi:hypothetical protein